MNPHQFVPAVVDYLHREDLNSVPCWCSSDQVPLKINTEVNSGNFIGNCERNTLHSVEWKKFHYGDPSQNLSHICAPMTTLSSTNYRMTSEEKEDTYNKIRSHLDINIQREMFDSYII